MERLSRSSICALAHGSLAEGGATVDHHLMVLCRPHYKPPSALLPVGIYRLPLSQGSTTFRSCRHVRDISFTPHDPSLLLACTSDDALLAFDMNAGAFFSETQLLAEQTGAAKSRRNAACVHVNRCPAAPLVFAGSPEGDVLIFDIRISGINAKFSGRKVCPAIRLPAAHDGALCGIRTGLTLHSHLFLTGGREDRWLRIFDLRFPLHCSSGGSSCQNHVPYPLEAIRLGTSENDGRFRNCLMALDVSPDGSLLAASVAGCHSGQLPSVDAIPEGDGETVLLSLRDGARTLKTIASADACAAEFIQFSPNGKYILQTGGVRATHCRLCWRCSCGCSCESQTWQGFVDLSDKATTRSWQYCVSNFDGSEENSVLEQTSGDELQRGQMLHGDGPPNHHSLSARRCSYHRAQLVNLVQSNRTVNLKSPADSAIAFTDSFCLSHSPRRPQASHGGATQLGPFKSGDAALGSCGQPPALCVAGNCDISSHLNFRLHGPQTDHVQRSRQRFWAYLSGLQNQSVAASPKGTGVDAPKDFTVQLPGTRSEGRQDSDAEITSECNSRKLALMDCFRDIDQPTANIVEKYAGEGVGDIANETHSASRCLLFPLLHPQLSQFITACGPLHPAFVRAEAATFPFTCRLWGGLVVGFGGSTADRHGCRRLYEGLKLWDSTTGVVLSWTEGYLASEGSLRCLAPLPDVSSGLIATGSSLPFNTRTWNAAPSEGVTFWAVRRRDDLLLSALDGALHLRVE